jgi:hypothetical protein
MRKKCNGCELEINYEIKKRLELNTDLNVTWILQLLSHLGAEVVKYNKGKYA